MGFAGVIYMVIVIRRMRMQSSYRPDAEDWLFHAWLPLAANVVLAFSALAAWWHETEALFGVAGATLLLLFIGIHNSWDTIAYQVLIRMRELKE